MAAPNWINASLFLNTNGGQRLPVHCSKWARMALMFIAAAGIPRDFGGSHSSPLRSRYTPFCTLTISSNSFIPHSPNLSDKGKCAPNRSGGSVVNTPSVSTLITVPGRHANMSFITCDRHHDVTYPAIGNVWLDGALSLPPARCAIFP